MKSSLVFALLFGFQLWLLSQLTLFLAPEFSLYPYFSERGLLPYRQIIDQHFPLLLFGPIHLGMFNLPSRIGLGTIVLSSPAGLLAVLTALITGINLFFWLLLPQHLPRLTQRILVQLGLVLAITLLAINHLWLESFALFFVLLGLIFKRLPIFTGLFWGAAVIIRPLLLPFLFLLWWQSKRSREILVGGALMLLLVVWWLSTHELWSDFLELLRFNGQYYRPMASRLPNRGELIRLGWVIGWLVLLFKPLRNNKLILPTMAAALLPSFPRFELYHNLLLLTLPVWPGIKLRINRLMLMWLVLGLGLTLRQINIEPDVNFFYPADLYRQAAVINKYEPTDVYFFGGPDQLYFLTNTLPPGSFYLPSLPWYHANPVWIERQLTALKTHPQALVVVNTESRIDGQSLLDYSSKLYQFIRQNYQLVETVGPLEIYRYSLPLAYL